MKPEFILGNQLRQYRETTQASKWEITLAATEDEPQPYGKKILCGGGLMERHRLLQRPFNEWSRQWLIPYTG